MRLSRCVFVLSFRLSRLIRFSGEVFVASSRIWYHPHGSTRFCKSSLLHISSFPLHLDGAKLCERKRELEVEAANRAAEARERAAEEQLKRLPEHQQQLLQVGVSCYCARAGLL